MQGEKNKTTDVDALLGDILGSQPDQAPQQPTHPTPTQQAIPTHDKAAGSAVDVETLVNLAAVEMLTGVDLARTYCSKTGQPVGRVEPETLALLMRMYSVSSLEQLAPVVDLASGVAPHWVKTGPDALTRLQRIDPRGFFTYCIGVALRSHHQVYNKGRSEWRSPEHARLFRNSLVKCWHAIGAVDGASLEEANKHLRFFMFLDLHNRKYYRVPWHMVRAQQINAFERVLLVNDSRAKNIGNNTLLVEPYSTEPAKHTELVIDKLNASYAVQQRTYNPEISPLLPHEFASYHGIGWIKHCLASYLQRLAIKMRIDDIVYNNLHTASAFRPRSNFQGDARDVDEMIGDVGLHMYSMRHARMVREKQAQIKKAQQRGREVTEATVEGLIKFNLKIIDQRNAGPTPQPPLATQTETTAPVAPVAVPAPPVKLNVGMLAGLLGKKG